MHLGRFAPLTGAALYGLLALPAAAQEWNVGQVRAPAAVLDYTATEGTWISVDVSPDGRHVIFDLLGHLYEMPVTGGDARPLTTGHAWNNYPRYSPDGRRIAFTSDRGGTSAVWVMDRATGAVEQVSRMDVPVVRPTWAPDGRHVFATATNLHSRSVLHQFNVERGTHQTLTTAAAMFSPVYAAVQDTARGQILFSQAGEPLPGGGHRIVRWDVRTGDTATYLRRPGGAVAPVLSPDGRHLAYVTREDRVPALVLHDLETRRERVLVRGLDRDRQEGLPLEGAYPGIAWHPEGREVFVSYGGGIHAVDVRTGTPRSIPFRAPVRREVERTLRFPIDVPEGRARTRYHAWAQRTEQGIVFAALGDLYLARGSGEPVNLTRSDAIESSPAYDPATRTLYYASWSDQGLGAIHARRLPGGRPVRLTSVPAQYGSLTLSADGRSLAFLRSAHPLAAGERLEEQRDFDLVVLGPDRVERRVTGIRWRAHASANQAAKQPPGITFSPDGTELYFTEFLGDTLALRRIRVDGERAETLYTFPEATRAVVSPDLRWIAFREFSRSYVAPYEFVGRPLALTGSGGDRFVLRVDAEDGEFTGWTRDGAGLYWTRGTGFYEKPLAEVLTEEGAARRTELSFDFDVPAPAGAVALTGVRVVTMNGAMEVLENATVVLRGGRIEAVGRDVAVPAGARVFDLAGRTVIPGLIDSHAHYGGAVSPLLAVEQNSAGLLAYLAYGVTTVYEVYGSSHKDFLLSDLQRAGRSRGARLFSVGAPIFGLHYRPKLYREIRSLDDAREHVRFNRDHGALSLKDYTHFSRAARQRLVAAARELGVNVVSETAADPQMNLTQLVDGVSGLEHTPGLTPLYDDFVRLFAATEAGITPTLGVVYGGPVGERFFHQRERLWEDPKLLNFFRRDDLMRFRRPVHHFDDDVYAVEMAGELRKLHEAGVPIQVGGHGQMYGLDNHWEMELLVRGGFTPLEALRFATINGARYHGLDRQLGSIEPGKLADLVVLERDPLEDIRHSRMVEYVIQNGVVYRGADASRVHPDPSPAPRLYFQD